MSRIYDKSASAACVLLAAYLLAGCNALLGVEPLKSEPDASIRHSELSMLAADSGNGVLATRADGGTSDPAATLDASATD